MEEIRFKHVAGEYDDEFQKCVSIHASDLAFLERGREGHPTLPIERHFRDRDDGG